MKSAHLCSDATIYVWQPLKATSLACPRGKERIDAPHIKKEQTQNVVLFYKLSRVLENENIAISFSGTVQEDERSLLKADIEKILKKIRKT